MKQRKRNRLRGYDYSQDNLYSVTSCVQGRICCLGEIVNDEMILNQYGKIAYDQWLWRAEQYRCVVLHEFVVMPNHMHGIIEINREIIETWRTPTGTGHDLSLRSVSGIKIKSLSELIGAYKTTTSKKNHLAEFDKFEWQRSFHDHIIRNEASYVRIADYILNNPSSWEDDKFFGK